MPFRPGAASGAPLAWAHPVTRDWFVARFGTPTEPQIEGWPHIVAGRDTLISAPTGSGKTLAAFLVRTTGPERSPDRELVDEKANKEMAWLVEVSPKEICSVLGRFIETHRPDFDYEDRLKVRESLTRPLFREARSP